MMLVAGCTVTMAVSLADNYWGWFCRKGLVEAAPTPIKEGVSMDEAKEIKEKIEAVGGSVEIK